MTYNIITVKNTKQTTAERQKVRKVMKTFNYEWWVVSIHFTNGTVDCEFKGKNKENIIRQIKKEVKEINSGKRGYQPQIIEVYWETLRLDRIGYQRLS